MEYQAIGCLVSVPLLFATEFAVWLLSATTPFALCWISCEYFDIIGSATIPAQTETDSGGSTDIPNIIQNTFEKFFARVS
ncbi:hypothetical protein AYI68_g2817 [Smittium mucronatum]|uniref:Uncharacterized protein n=1 Tax=Smittium mucronatum TaxID=133383 RepID=A0A1R0H1N1_9FUNG|nr:hypothetical protein AYI68_g2817 [Smittium mucronatum]